MKELEPVQRALVVTPHPDDAEFGCAGTVALLVREGKEVFYVVATSGNKGGRDTDMTADYLTTARQDEQRRAAETVGVSEVVFLDFGDGELEDDHAFRRELVYHIRRLKPDIVFTTDPFRTSFYIHRDHRMAGIVTLDASFPYARDRLHYPEHIQQGLDGHNVQEVFLWGVGVAGHVHRRQRGHRPEGEGAAGAHQPDAGLDCGGGRRGGVRRADEGDVAEDDAAIQPAV